MRDSIRRLSLEVAAGIHHLVPVLPGRFLNYLGLELFNDRLFSDSWKTVGVIARRGRVHGYWMTLDPSFSDQRMACVTAEPGDRSITRFIRRHLREGEVFIDIGANIGMYTLVAARVVGPRGRVISLEPNPDAFAILQAHLSMNRIKHAEALQCALGSRAGMMNLHSSHGESPLATFRSESSEQCIPTRMERGDDILQDIPRQARGICKIDVEGYELEACKGLARFIESHARFMYCIEVTESWMREVSGAGSDELCRFFAAAGFWPYLIQQNGVLKALQHPPQEYQSDIVFANRSQVKQ